MHRAGARRRPSIVCPCFWRRVLAPFHMPCFAHASCGGLALPCFILRRPLRLSRIPPPALGRIPPKPAAQRLLSSPPPRASGACGTNDANPLQHCPSVPETAPHPLATLQAPGTPLSHPLQPPPPRRQWRCCHSPRPLCARHLPALPRFPRRALRGGLFHIASPLAHALAPFAFSMRAPIRPVPPRPCPHAHARARAHPRPARPGRRPHALPSADTCLAQGPAISQPH